MRIAVDTEQEVLAFTVYDYERDKKEVPGGREADSGIIGRWMRRGRSGKFHCVAEPQVPMHAFVMPGNRYDVGE